THRSPPRVKRVKRAWLRRDLALLSSSGEGAQCQIDRHGRGGIERWSDRQHAEDRGADCTGRYPMPADLTCGGADGQTTLPASEVETVLLYNAADVDAETRRLRLERQLDSAHSGLLRAAFRADESVGTEALYDQAKLQRPSTILRRRRLQLAGHVIRAEATALTCSGRPALLTLGRGQARTRRYVDYLLCDAGAPDTANGADFVLSQALRRAI
uniref:DUF3395 domain-containing protein n=1 Tax=Macrostomum lignano TaxID=282301 RepID=A0A1I8I1P4_9PLAT